MSLLIDWITHEAPPDAWTAERRDRATLLALFSGNVEIAAREWASYERARFVRWCVVHGRIGRGDRSAEPATDGRQR